MIVGFQLQMYDFAGLLVEHNRFEQVLHWITLTTLPLALSENQKKKTKRKTLFMQMKSTFYSRSSEHGLTYALCKHREKWSYISVYKQHWINPFKHECTMTKRFWRKWVTKIVTSKQQKWSLRVRNNFWKFHRILGLMSFKVIKYLEAAS